MKTVDELILMIHKTMAFTAPETRVGALVELVDQLQRNLLTDERSRVEGEFRQNVHHLPKCHWIKFCGDTCTCGVGTFLHKLWNPKPEVK